MIKRDLVMIISERLLENTMRVISFLDESCEKENKWAFNTIRSTGNNTTSPAFNVRKIAQTSIDDSVAETKKHTETIKTLLHHLTRIDKELSTLKANWPSDVLIASESNDKVEKAEDKLMNAPHPIMSYKDRANSETEKKAKANATLLANAHKLRERDARKRSPKWRDRNGDIVAKWHCYKRDEFCADNNENFNLMLEAIGRSKTTKNRITAALKIFRIAAYENGAGSVFGWSHVKWMHRQNCGVKSAALIVKALKLKLPK